MNCTIPTIPTIPPAAGEEIGTSSAGAVTLKLNGLTAEVKLPRAVHVLPFSDEWKIACAKRRVQDALAGLAGGGGTRDSILELIRDPAVLVYGVTAQWNSGPAALPPAGGLRGTLVLALGTERREVEVNPGPL